ncbi:MAG: sensor histidine kinase [Vicinamibacterales bacterium]
MIGPRWLIAVSVAAIATLAWTSYSATNAWRLSASQLAARRAESSVSLLVTALTRDMRAVQTLVLAPGAGERPASLTDRVARAFARYPYPEVFFAWRRDQAAAGMVFYARTDRPPVWLPEPMTPGYESLQMVSDAELGAGLLAHVAPGVTRSPETAFFDIARAGVRYQAVAQLVHADAHGDVLDAVFGFLVNLPWTRDHYFGQIVDQTRGIGGVDPATAFRILDASGRVVVGPPPDGRQAVRRTFPLLFFDPVLAATGTASPVTRDVWAAEAVVGDDPVLAAANQGAGQVALLAALAATALFAGFLLTVRAGRASADLARMRADFMLAITHELKTPIASIRALTETLASGRTDSAEMVRDYSRLAAQEAKRLGRLIENLLAHARITDVTQAYAFDAVGVDVLIDDTLADFSTQLEHGGFDVDVDLAADLPPVRVDRTAMRLALGNLVDNAVRYSGPSRLLEVHARREGRSVVIDVSDRGVGIPPDEVQQVWTKFFRGRRAAAGGSGLGLAIAQRIVQDHNGSLSIPARPGPGTTVRIALPIVEQTA